MNVTLSDHSYHQEDKITIIYFQFDFILPALLCVVAVSNMGCTVIYIILAGVSKDASADILDQCCQAQPKPKPQPG